MPIYSAAHVAELLLLSPQLVCTWASAVFSHKCSFVEHLDVFIARTIHRAAGKPTELGGMGYARSSCFPGEEEVLLSEVHGH